LFSAGAAGTPSIAFSGDTDTGWFLQAAAEMRAVTSGITRIVVNDTSIAMRQQVQAINGSAGTPSYSFENDTNTGIFWNSADDMRLVAGGVAGVIVTGNGSLTNVEFGSSSSSAMTFNCITAATASTGASGAPPAQVAGYLTVTINGTARKIPYYAT
jgi:hypothetical protein